MSYYTLYLKVKNHWGDQEIEPYLYFCTEGDDSEFIFTGKALRPAQLSDIIWKEDHKGVKIVKDRYSGVVRHISTEDEHKEFMWVKLRSQNYNGQI